MNFIIAQSERTFKGVPMWVAIPDNTPRADAYRILQVISEGRGAETNYTLLHGTKGDGTGYFLAFPSNLSDKQKDELLDSVAAKVEEE